MIMNPFFPIIFFFFFLLLNLATSTNIANFTFNGFTNSNLHLDGIATITSSGLLELTESATHMKGHAFFPIPLHFKSSANKTFSFSTTFVFAILSEVSYLGGNGIAFVVAPTDDLSTALASQYLGLFNQTSSGSPSNHIFAVELDTIQNPEFQDINDNHIGIDINSLKSLRSVPAGYYDDVTGKLKNLTLLSSQPLQAWVDFDGDTMEVNVTVAPIKMTKPSRPILSTNVDLSSLMFDSMYVGFSASTGAFHTSHCILGWSFMMNGEADPIDYAKLPALPLNDTRGNSHVLEISLPISLILFVLLTVAATVILLRRRKKYAELLEDWEVEYGPHRFSYKDLFQATKGFREKELLGSGGFGRVYKGVLPSSKMEVAVKKISHESRQGMRQFVAEIVSIGQLRHRNLVQLLGYCRRKGELLLVYDCMPNGSLDKYLHNPREPTLEWAQRFQIIKGVASGLLYLHEDWEQVVIHRDIKASNVLLDSELNGRLGDFGLARLYDHGSDPHTTHIVGTMGYLAPEMSRTGKATTATDVFAFGAFLLEVACGRRPVEPHEQGDKLLLMDWVLLSWQRGFVLETMDERLGEEFSDYEVELVLKLGLLCSNPVPGARPNMRQVVNYLEGDAFLPELPQSYLNYTTLSLFRNEGFDNNVDSFCSSVSNLSGLSEGR